MTTFLLTVTILINGVWTPGSSVDGWSPLPYRTEAACLERKAIANRLQRELMAVEPRARPKRWECVSAGADA